MSAMFRNDSNLKDPVGKLVFELSKLPGIGEKTATRLAYFILKQDAQYARSLAEAINKAKELTRLCTQCLTFTDLELCQTCNDPERDRSIVCVVEKPSDVVSIDRAVSFKGMFHVLHGVLSPLDGIGPNELRIRELLTRVEVGQFKEIILAMNPGVEGDATAIYLAKLLKPLQVKLTKLAHGIPVGGQLEYSDRLTISRALENRVEMRL